MAAAIRLSQQHSCSFAPGSIFALVRWASNDYGTVASRIDILRAVRRGERYSTISYVCGPAEKSCVLPTIQDAVREARATRPDGSRIRVGLTGFDRSTVGDRRDICTVPEHHACRPADHAACRALQDDIKARPALLRGRCLSWPVGSARHAVRGCRPRHRREGQRAELRHAEGCVSTQATSRPRRRYPVRMLL